MPAPLVDQFGRTARYQTTGGASLYEDTQQKNLRLSRSLLDKDYSSLLSKSKFKALLSDSRYIYAAFDIVSGAVKQKSGYVCANGWMPRFLGQDQDWEAKAMPVLRRSLAAATNKGWSYNKLWKLGCRTFDRDGGFFLLRHKSPHTGAPVHQVIEAHRIGNRHHSDRAKGDRYDGATQINGIIYSDDGREIAYHVLGATEEEDTQVAAKDMRHICDYDFFSENRPMPKIAYSAFDLYDVKETRGFQKIGQKVRSAISLVEKNETGTNILTNPVPGSSTIAGEQTAGGMRVETFEAGMIRYIRNGGSIDTINSDQPGGSWLEFDQTIVNGAMYGIEWRSEMQDLSRLKGAGIRGFADNINQTIFATHELIAGFAYAELMWRLSCHIERGDIPEHPEWDQFGFPAPRRFDPDPSKTNASEIDNVRAGRTSMSHLIHLDGDDEDEVLIAQAKYLQKKNNYAAQYGVDPAELGNLSIPGAVSNTARQQAQTEQEATTRTAETLDDDE